MAQREKDMQEQEADKGRQFLLFGLRHPLVTIVLVLLAMLAVFIYAVAGSIGTLAPAGIGMIAASGGGPDGQGYFGGSGEEYRKATQTQKKIVDCCYLTPASGEGLCATWVYNVFTNAGYIGVGGNANDMWEQFCYTNDISKLEVGMIIAVLHSGATGDSWLYGHVGIYIGDDRVMHSTGAHVEITPLADWIATFDPFNTVKWGFPPAVKAVVEKEQAERPPETEPEERQ